MKTRTIIVDTSPSTEIPCRAGGWSKDYKRKVILTNFISRFQAHIDPDHTKYAMSSFIQGRPWQLGGQAGSSRYLKLWYMCDKWYYVFQTPFPTRGVRSLSIMGSGRLARTSQILSLGLALFPWTMIRSRKKSFGSCLEYNISLVRQYSSVSDSVQRHYPNILFVLDFCP